MSGVKELVLTYFRGVDEQQIDLILATLDPDCVFSVETHAVRLQGHDEIAACLTGCGHITRQCGMTGSISLMLATARISPYAFR